MTKRKQTTVLETDDFEFDEDAWDDLDDFESDEFWQPSRHAGRDYLDGMWGRRGFRSAGAARSEDVIIAHGMVQTFVNAFARDRRYEVVFDPSTSTASTDMRTYRIKVTPAPILDESIDAQQAGRILTGLAVHEVCHPRFGKDTWQAVQEVFKQSASARRLGNLLDDVRIERRYVDDYPGYSGVFTPTLEYIGDASVKANGGSLVLPRMDDQLNIATGAVRYPGAMDWDGFEQERDWWKAWAERWSKEDAPRRHVEAVREGLRHVLANVVRLEMDADPGQGADGDAGDDDDARPDQSEDDGGPGQDDASAASGDDADADASNDAGAGGPDEADDVVADLSDDELAAAVDESQSDQDQLPTCSGEAAVEEAAEQAGVDKADIQSSREEAQRTIEDQKFYEDDGSGHQVQVLRSLRGVIHGQLRNRGSRWFEPSGLAERYVRDALLRSRTGHTDVSKYQKRGRLDNRGLHRIAQRDFRLFERRQAESPGKYLVWMLLDRSGSMDGSPSEQQAQVATAIADATRHVKTVRAAVWAWSDPFRDNGDSYVDAGVVRAWETGQPTAQIALTIDLPSGGTPDATILRWATKAILADARQSETPVILLCSDGWGDGNLGVYVEDARRRGVVVRSVAFGQLNEESQRQRFGKDGYVAWRGSILETARPLSSMIARMVGRDRR